MKQFFFVSTVLIKNQQKLAILARIKKSNFDFEIRLRILWDIYYRRCVPWQSYH